MKLVRNDQQIKRNKLIGNVMTFTSLGVLGLGLYFAFQKICRKFYIPMFA